jgi:hypothetical protein
METDPTAGLDPARERLYDFFTRNVERLRIDARSPSAPRVPDASRNLPILAIRCYSPGEVLPSG